MSPILVRLKQLREERGLSQSALAKKTGLSQSLISRIESGELPNVGLDTVERLAEALNVTLTELLEHKPRRR